MEEIEDSDKRAGTERGQMGSVQDWTACSSEHGDCDTCTRWGRRSELGTPVFPMVYATVESVLDMCPMSVRAVFTLIVPLL